MLVGAALSSSVIQGQTNMIFGGGALYHDIEENADIIRSSGFNTITLWSIHIGTNGALVLNESTIVEGGEYVGRPTWPDGVRKLLEAPTSVNRIELSVGSYGVPDWENIEALVKSEGTGPASALYKNFARVREVLPEITAINNDDESNYDVETTVAFSKMLIDLGYKITFAPYKFPDFWENVYNELETYSPGSVDKVYLQLYAGGARNDPANWNTRFDVKVTPGLWCYNAEGCAKGDSPERMEKRLRDWNNATGIDGGFIWLFDDMLRCTEKATVQEYANAINRAFEK